jgi:FAD/FMN-containing dehydrogenase
LIPVIEYVSDDHLRAVIAYCRELGISSNNPHTCYLEGTAHEAGIAAQLALKHAADPKALLNPGKLRAAATSPAVAQAMPEFLYP